MDNGILRVDKLLTPGTSAEDVKKVQRYFDHTLKSIASDVVRACSSQNVPYNLETIQKVILRRNLRPISSLVPFDIALLQHAQSEPAFLKLIAQTVKKGIDDGSLISPTISNMFQKAQSSLNLNAQKLDAKVESNGANGAGAKRAKRARVRAARREGGVIKTMKRAGAAVGKAVRWIFRLPPKVKG